MVDQSVDELSERAYRKTVGDDPRFSYIPSETVGKPIACNLALGRARGTILAFTDDDCVAPPDWLAGMESAMEVVPRVAAICGGVTAGLPNRDRGFVPTFRPPRPRLHRSVLLAYQSRGIGANMAVRAQMLRDIGGFDEILGPGAPVGAGTDSDVLCRLLRRGHWILDVPEPAVVHYGYRVGQQIRPRLWTYSMSDGAICMKHLRCGDAAFVPSLVVRGARQVKWANIAQLRRPTGVTTFTAFVAGALMSFRYPIDRSFRTYVRVQRSGSARKRRRALDPAEWWRTSTSPTAPEADPGLPITATAPNPPASDRAPRATVCIPTRNRGVGIIPTLDSLARLEHQSFEVIVVDQSQDDTAQRAYEQTVGDDPRFSYVRSQTAGRSTSCNLGLARARGELIAFTDDDCVVPRGWISDMELILARHSEAAMVCGGITAAADASDAYYTPSFSPTGEWVYRTRWLAYQVSRLGGANLVFRTEPLRTAGGFDELLGVGAPLKAGEDFDLMYRVLQLGYAVVVVAQPAVVHHELKEWKTEGRRLQAGYLFSQGALVMKHIRRGDPAAVFCLVLIWLRTISWRRLVLLRPASGVRSFVAFGRGAATSFRYPIDRRSRTYIAPRFRKTV